MNDLVKKINSDYCYVGKRIEPFETRANISKIKDVLGWQPKEDLDKFIKENFKCQN